MIREAPKNSRLRRWTRRIAVVFFSLMVILILIRLSLKTELVRGWVKSIALSIANEKLNAEITIGKVTGDLWKGLTARDIVLIRQDTLASIDSATVEYNLWALLEGKVELSNLFIYQPKAYVRQYGDQWNIENLVKPPAEFNMLLETQNMHLTNGILSIQSDSLPMASNIEINKFELSSTFQYKRPNFKVTLRSFTGELGPELLGNPVSLESAAKVDNNTLTLEKLVAATANSVIKSDAFVNVQDSSVQFNMSASPFSWKDIVAYSQEIPLKNDLQIKVGLKGRPEQFDLSFDLQAEGIERFAVLSRFKWNSSLILQQAEVTTGYIDPEVLTGDSLLPSFQNMQATFSGRINASDYQNGTGEWNFSVDRISRDHYQLDKLSGFGSLRNQTVNIEMNARSRDQKFNVEFSIAQMFADLPFISAKITGTHIDPEYWMQDPLYSGDISFTSTLTGRGWIPDSTDWDYSFNMWESQIADQPISKLTAEGKLSMQGASLDAQMVSRDSQAKIAANIRQLDTDPRYDFKLEAKEIDLGKIMGIENFTTNLNGTIFGEGQGIDPEIMQVTSTFEMDSSLVNNELIEKAFADISVQNAVATADTMYIQSTVADGSFSGQLYLLNILDSGNKLDFDLTIKDIRSLAPLATTDSLGATGSITGNLNPDEKQGLRFRGAFDFSDLYYGQIFSAPGAKGNIDALIRKEVTYETGFALESPVFSGLAFQDLILQTKGKYKDTNAKGQFKFQLNSKSEDRIEQAGDYAIFEDSILVKTTLLNLVSENKTLSLESSFITNIQGDTIRMDTMKVASGDTSFVVMAAPLITPVEQKGFVHAEGVDTGVLQRTFGSEIYFEGLLSAKFELSRMDTFTQGFGYLRLSDIIYNEAEFDSLIIETKIGNDRLKSTQSLLQNGVQLISGDFDLPFIFEDIEKATSSFFEQPLNGTVRIRDIPMENFRFLLPDKALARTDGTISFYGRLEGRVDNPQLNVNAALKNGSLSGISVDSAILGIDYDQSGSLLVINSSVISEGQKAANFNASIPLFINTKTFELNLPGEDDSVSVEVEANNFDLAAMNDFLSEFSLSAGGRLDGNLLISGTQENPIPEGSFALKNGAFEHEQTGFGITGVQSTIQFKSDQVILNNFTAEGGKGKLRANGKIQLQDSLPGDMEIRVKADNYRAVNTPDQNAVINMSALIQGTLTKPRISGNIDFVSGYLMLQDFGDELESIEEISLDTLEGDSLTLSFIDSLSLEMDVEFDRRFFIRNEASPNLEVELDGELELLKEVGKDLQLFGTMNSTGYLRPFGKRFELKEGSVNFLGNPMNPELDIRAEYEPPKAEEKIIISYIIEGTLEEPIFTFESDPPMESEQIVSYTLFGEPFQVSDVAMNILSSRLEQLAAQQLNIDYVQIETQRLGGQSGASITTGWYLNQKTFFAIQNIITNASQNLNYLLEYFLRRNLKLIISQGNNVHQGAYLQWDHDY